MDVIIDTRPLWMVLLSHTGRPIRFAVGILAFYLVATMETPEGLTLEGQRALAVFVLCISYWMLNVLPLMITSLMAIALIPLTGVLTSAETYALFGNSAVFFILGAFILAACLMKSGLSTRLSLVILRRFGDTPRRLLLGTFLLNASMAFFMSEHAVAAMNFPIIAEIVAVLGLRPHRSNFGKALFLAMAWGSTIGGVATLLGGGRAPLALAILEQATGDQPYTFLSWSLYTLPVVAVMLGAGYLVILRWFPIDIESVREAETVLAEKVDALGRLRGDEKGIAIVMISTVTTWVFFGHSLGLANVAIGAIVVLFAVRLVEWRDVEEYVNWGIILMYGGAICLGAALDKSGAALWVAESSLGPWADSPRLIIAAMSGVAWLLTEAMSNSAVVALMMPVGLGIGQDVGFPVAIIAPVVAIPAGLAFAFPIGTPSNAIAYSSGYLRLRDLFVPGMLLGLIAWIVFNLTVNFYWPLLGFSPV